MPDAQAEAFARALEHAPVLTSSHQELATPLGSEGARLVVDAALPYIHDGRVSRRGVVERLTLGQPPVFGDRAKSPTLAEAHAVVDVLEHVAAEQHAARPAAPAEEIVDVDIADVAGRIEHLVELAEHGSIVRITRSGHAVASIVGGAS
jgi:hypothetical protein